MCPSANLRVDLGDFYELWTGLFQSTLLGSIPYVNVDIAHKAFPSQMRIVDIIRGLGGRQGPTNLNQEMDRYSLLDLEKHLKGLRIGYNMPGAGVKSYKYLDLSKPAFQNVFESDGQKITVQEYYRRRNAPLQFPKLPCLHVGSAIRNICLPVELCFILPGQVSAISDNPI